MANSHFLFDLAFNVLGIYICYILYGLLQEKITTHNGSFTLHLYLMLVQCLINCAFIYPKVWIDSKRHGHRHKVNNVDNQNNNNQVNQLQTSPDHTSHTNHAPNPQPNSGPSPNPNDNPPSTSLYGSGSSEPESSYFFMAATYLGGMLFSYLALSHISFPTQVLVKSSKMLPVMFIGVFFFRKVYSIYEYTCVFLVSFGVYLFFVYGAVNKESSNISEGIDNSNFFFDKKIMGVFLSFVSLLMDGLTGAQQDEFIKKFRPSPYKLMFKINFWAVILLFIAATVFSDQLLMGIQMTLNDFSFLFDLIIFGIVSAAGQIFIFRMVTNQGALLLALTTSTRKFFTILGSVIYFNHILTKVQYMAVVMVFIGLTIDILYKSSSKKKHKQT